MKIKARPDDAERLESDELFQMNGWLAELRDEARAESWDEDRSGAEENSYAEPRGDGRAESTGGGHAGPWPDSRAGSREDGRARLRDDSQAGLWQDGHSEPRSGGYAEPWPDSYARLREDGRARLRDDGQAGSRWDGRARPRDDRQARPSRHGYPRPEAMATAPVTRAQTKVYAVIGDQLRLPIMWCEMGACISWFAHPAALGEADIRARAIDAGWRMDAVGLLVCPQCVQTAPGFQSPLPVVQWDGQEAEAVMMSAPMADEPSAEAIMMSAPVADDMTFAPAADDMMPAPAADMMPAPLVDEPSAEATASVAQELSHDLRRPVSDQRDEAGATSAWIAAAAVPADGVARSASEGPREEVRHPADDHLPEHHQPENRRPENRQPEKHPRSGRHRKRFAARLTFASH